MDGGKEDDVVVYARVDGDATSLSESVVFDDEAHDDVVVFAGADGFDAPCLSASLYFEDDDHGLALE